MTTDYLRQAHCWWLNRYSPGLYNFVFNAPPPLAERRAYLNYRIDAFKASKS